MVETAGRRWVAERVTTAASISNGLTLAALRGERDRLRTRVAEAEARQACTLAAARRARGPADLFRALRSHGPAGGAPRYRWWNGAMSAPCAHAGGALASTQTTASWVAELSPDGDRHWVTATAAPCLSLYKPVRVDLPLDLGPAPTDRADPASLWWRHERLHRRAIGDRAVSAAIVAERDALEARWLASPPPPADAFAEADRALARWTDLAAGARNDRPWLVRRYWAVRDRRAGLDRAPAPAAEQRARR